MLLKNEIKLNSPNMKTRSGRRDVSMFEPMFTSMSGPGCGKSQILFLRQSFFLEGQLLAPHPINELSCLMNALTGMWPLKEAGVGQVRRAKSSLLSEGISRYCIDRYRSCCCMRCYSRVEVIFCYSTLVPA